MWTLDTGDITLDAGEVQATLDGWLHTLGVVLAATVTVLPEVSRVVVVKPFVDRTVTWKTN